MNILIVGCGVMAHALFSSSQGGSPNLNFFCYDIIPDKAQQLASFLNGQSVTSLEGLSPHVIFIAVKPQDFRSMASSLIPLISPQVVIYSIMAGIKTDAIQAKLGPEKLKIIRLMPNTPCAVKEGTIIYYPSELVTQEDKANLTNLFKESGKVFPLDKEDQLDFITPISGSGPAYLVELANIFSSFLQSKGIPQELSEQISVQTIYGSGKWLSKSSFSFQKLKEQVASKQGVTGEVLTSLEQADMEKLWHEAFQKGLRRTFQLSEEFGPS